MPSSAAMGETAKRRYYGSTKWIERIVLTNFRPIRSLSLDFSRSASGNGPWTVLLGENGTGKSSILQALALTLMGEEQRRRLMPDASRNLRHGARVGSVEVYLAGSTEPLVLRFRKGLKDFEAPNAEPALLLGYGSTRLPSRDATTPAQTNEAAVRVDNLFDPLLPITDPTQWLMSLDDELFDRVSGWLGQLLAFERSRRLVRDRAAGTVELRAGRSRSTLAELSDGYQSMLILACDVMRTLLPLWKNNLEQAEGIVLIDELGTHLHPRWRMRIVAALRGVLPRVQFVATTHDPLCLRGLEDGEVTVLRRNEKQDVISFSDLPSVKGLRVEQLLASDFFGLGSTRDPQVDDLYDEYYRMRSRRRLSQKGQTRLARIEKDLMELDRLGTTEQERLVFRAAGDYIAQRRASGDDDREEHPRDDDIRQELLELWSAVLPSPEDEIG
jgi:energy-coupling factor transporter ATP-binding protein EcfA2